MTISCERLYSKITSSLKSPEYLCFVAGESATRLVVDEGRRVANCCTGPQRQELLRLCDETEILTNQLSDLCRRGQVSEPRCKCVLEYCCPFLLYRPTSFYGEQSVFVFYLNACWVLKIKVSSKCFTMYIRLGIHSIQGGPDIVAMVDWVSQTNYLRIPARRQLSSDYFGLIFGVVWKDKNGFPLYYEPSGFHFEMYFWSTVAFCCRATLRRPRQYLATCQRNWHLWKPRYKMHLSVR